MTESTSPTPWPVTAKSVAQVTEPTSLSTSTALTNLPYEILEMILLFLPMRDLLLSQRICRYFKETIVSSKTIQRALFFEPSHYPENPAKWDILRWNPLFEEKLAPSFNIRIIGVSCTQEGFVKMVAHARLPKDASACPKWSDCASWKSMMITQPPATLLLHPASSLFWKTPIESQAQFFHDPDGFRISDIVTCEGDPAKGPRSLYRRESVTLEQHRKLFARST
ncbi:unnamed protein product [Periconia digitata]|uniref:F-box domain-containing protein n=1 Tax=Periconia digitata TaxID=1303443 RepID=A0A9W4UIE6_9PLEO|nr:unnamed protein product [Periconia digitata]